MIVDKIVLATSKEEALERSYFESGWVFNCLDDIPYSRPSNLRVFQVRYHFEIVKTSIKEE